MDGTTFGAAVSGLIKPPVPTISYEFLCDESAVSWQVLRVHYTEFISRPYTLILDLVTDDMSADIDGLLGATCQFSLLRDGFELVEDVFGLIGQTHFLGYSDTRLLLRVEIVPAFALLMQRINSRIWQEMSVIDIVTTVLKEGFADLGRSFKDETSKRGQTSRDYCVQYRESDFQFVSRLLAEEGISYHFVHDVDQGHEVLILTDANDAFQKVKSAYEEGVVPLLANRGGGVEVEHLHSVRWQRSMKSTEVLRHDYDWKMPKQFLRNTAGSPDSRNLSRRVYVHGQRRYISDDVQERTDDQLESMAASAQILHGSGDVIGFRPGLTFKMEEPPIESLEIDFLLTQVEHKGYCPEVLLSPGESIPDHDSSQAEARYENSFMAIPLATPLRPLPDVPPRPQAFGPQTATVVGVGGEEIDTDEHGRIKVQFHWEEKPYYDDRSSCWVRVAQSWAGPSWGTQFIPRVGMEVVVEFLEGNPDRPLVTGCVYNGTNAPPFALPDNKTQSGIRTDSSPGGGGSNELRFEDAKGSEEIYLHGQKDWTIAIDNDKNQTVGNNETLSVGNDRTKDVGNNQTETIGVDKTITVGSNHTETIGSNMTQSVGANMSITVGANKSETVAIASAETVGAAKALSIGAAYQVSVGAAMNVSVGLAKMEEIGAAWIVGVGASSSENVGGSKSVNAGKSISQNAGKDISLGAGKNVSVTAGKNVAVNAGKDLAASAGKKMVLTAKDDLGISGDKKGTLTIKDKLVIKCGKATIEMKKNGDITISGAKISVKGKEVVVKGSKGIKNN